MFYFRRNRKGSILIVVVLFLTVFIGISGLVADFASAYSYKQKIKGAVDLAALAGVSILNDVSNASAAKTEALNFLNTNLTNDIAGFTAIALDDPNLDILVGIYDESTKTFTPDETSSTANAVYIMFDYNLPTNFSGTFMLDNLLVTNTSVASKQTAKYIAPGSGFPLVLEQGLLALAQSNGNMVDLYANGWMDNSYWTDYTNSNPSTTEVRNVLNFIQYGYGTPPPGISIGDTFDVNDGGMIGTYNDLDPSALIGNTYLFPIVPNSPGMTTTSLGFVAATIDAFNGVGSMSYLTITLKPGHIDSNFGGTSAGMGGNPTVTEIDLLAGSFTLVQ